MVKKPSHRPWIWTLHQFAGGLVMLGMLANVGCTVGGPRIGPLAFEQSRLIDLTHAFGADTIVWPTEQDFRLVVQQEGETPGGYYYASNRLEMAEHGGTHIDAPIHFARGGQTLDQIPIERLVEAAFASMYRVNADGSGITGVTSRFQTMGGGATASSDWVIVLVVLALRGSGRRGNSIWERN